MKKPNSRKCLTAEAEVCLTASMPKRSSRDEDETAFAVVAQAIEQGQEPDRAAVSAAAAALGRRGGLKGGPARAKALTAAKRKAIAKRAAAARWTRRNG